MHSTLNSNIKICPTCKNVFAQNSKVATLIASQVDDNNNIIDGNTYLYCSENCLLTKLDTLQNPEVPFFMQVEILERKQIKKKPMIWQIKCRQRKFHIGVDLANTTDKSV